MGAMKSRIKKIAEEQKKIGIQVKEKTGGYILAAFGFVVGLAWNDAIKALIENLFPLDKNNLLAKFIYALIVTVLIVAATVILTKKTEKDKIEMGR